MKSENILRAARNSLLCFFMALGAGFLVACGGGGGGGGGGGVATPQETLAAPGTPPAPSAEVQSESEILVTWNAAQGATSYNLYRSTNRDGTYTLVAGNISALRYLDTALSAEDIGYYYQLEACNSGGCSSRSPAVLASREFSVYLSDSAAEGVEYSGPNGSNGLTWKGGVFSAVEGVFEFSIADTTLGSVSLNIDWANAHVTPADFIGVDEQKVIDIVRIVQGLDEDGLPRQNGISVSERARTDVRGDLFDRVANVKDNILDIFVASSADRSGTFLAAKEYRIPNEETAMRHFVDTRKCLFSGVYDGNYRATVGPTDDGQIYYAIEPFANKATGVKFSNVNPSVDNNRAIATALSGPVDIGVIGSVITLSEGNELSFVTPRLVTGIWQEVNEGITDITVSGTSRITLAEGNPGATRRIVGVDRGGDERRRVLGLYVLDYFANDGVDFSNDGDGSFSGRYYDIGANVNFALSLTIAGDGSWSEETTNLILSGTRTAYNGDITATAITVGSITRDGDTHDNDYGSFEAKVGIGRTGAGTGTILGTWCDISGAVGVANPPEPLPQSPAAPTAVAASATRIDVAWYYPIEGAGTYNLYRRKAEDPQYLQVLVNGDIDTRGYRDTELDAGTEYFYQLEVCNTSGCSERSPEVSATTLNPEVSETPNPTP